MGLPLGKKLWIAGLLFFLVATPGLYFFRKETYALNKTVRLVSLRIFEYEELSRHRVFRYKIEFQRDYYKVYLLIPSPEKRWKEIVMIRYEDAVETSMSGFALEIDRGNIVSYDWPAGGRILRPSIVLRFFPAKNSSKQSGILFYKNGTWRALKRCYGAA